MITTLSIAERGLLLVNGVPVRWLRPGRHTLLRPWARVEVRRLPVDQVVADLRPEEAALAPAEELKTVDVAPTERAVVYRRGRPVRWLGQGRHYVLTVEDSVRVERLDASAVTAAPLPAVLRALAPSEDYVEATVPTGHAGLRYVDGTVDAVLEPGRHAAWQTVHAVNLAVVDLRERLLTITGQEVMTKDRVSLRLNVAAVFQVADVRRVATTAANADDLLYLAVQLATRDAVTTRTLDVLLAGRDTVAAELFAAVAPRAEAVGLKLVSLGLKDVVLPGEIRDLMNKVVQAQKEAEANVITRREETAATRSLAQTAQLLAEHPLLVRLKELEAYTELAGKVGTLHVVLGQDVAPHLQLKT